MKKFLVFLLSLSICFMPSLAFAAKNYNVKTITYDPLEKVISATILDQIADKTMQKTAKVPVTSYATGSTVASMIRLGVAGAVIYGIVEGVGWVIENGQVKKPVPVGPEVIYEYIWQFDSSRQNNSATDLCKSLTPNSGDGLGGTPIYLRVDLVSLDQAKCVFKQYNREGYNYIYRVKNPKYTPDSVKLVPVPDTELGDKVNNSPQAPQILPSVYNPNNPVGGPAPTLTSDALDKAVPTPETEPTGGTKPKPNVDTDGDGIPDTYDPEKPSLGDDFTLPAFCEWAVTMCDWYVKYKEDSKKTDEHREKEELPFYQKVKDWLDWTKEPPENNDNDNDVETEQPEPFDNSIFRTDRFSVSRQCPIPEQHTISLSGVSVNFSFDLTPLCKVLEFARPALVACSYLYAGYIIIGASRNG